MTYEIDQVKQFIAEKYGLPYEGGRVVGAVPDGEHLIPLGASLTPTRVAIRGGNIFIEPADAPDQAEPEKKKGKRKGGGPT